MRGSMNMFILTLAGQPQQVFSVTGPDDEQVVPMFEAEEDAERYVYLVDELNDPSTPELDVQEVEGSAIMKACDHQETNYVVYSKDDLIIPPRIL